MANEADRMSRAGNYVLGLMNEAERERAERDLERDALFRDAVLSVAERMRIIGAPPEPKSGPDERWRTVSARLAELPQMRGMVPLAGPTPSAKIEPPAAKAVALRRGTRGAALRAMAIAACLIVVFALGYIAGVLSPGLWATVAPPDTAGHIGTP